MRFHHRTLTVLMNGLLIGHLEKTKMGALIFSYDQQWLDTPGARPISLSMPLTKKIHAGDVVYNFFDNLLPDNSEIRARIQAKFNVLTSQPFDLLAMIGRDCVGAIQFVDGEIPKFKRQINGEFINDNEIAAILRGYQQYPLGMLGKEVDFRISIAGAQEKAAFLFYQNKWCRPVADTPTTHIFKLPIGYIHHQQIDLSDSCENEWLCSKIASAFGLPVARSEIMTFDGVKALVIERFDRRLSKDESWILRLPQEDMCQVLSVSPNLKYQADGGPGMTEVMSCLLGSVNPTEDREVFFRSQVLFWLLAAIDGHAKNFSVFIEPEGKYRLTPLYDVISAYPLIEKKQLQPQKIKMAMALKGDNYHYHWYNIQRRHFLSAAKVSNYSQEISDTILSDMLRNVENVIEHVSELLPNQFPTKISRPIFSGMREMKKRLEKKG